MDSSIFKRCCGDWLGIRQTYIVVAYVVRFVDFDYARYLDNM